MELRIMNLQNILAQLPSIDALLKHKRARELLGRYSHDFVKEALQAELAEIRQKLADSAGDEKQDREKLLALILNKAEQRIERFLAPSLKPVINATGIILHTGLGRAPLAQAAQDNIIRIMAGYSNLEIDRQTGKRGERNDHISQLLCRLTGAEAAVTVNNNAAAVFITLNTLCGGKEAIVSRGQLIEIGGSFRLPDVMQKSGCIMREIGSTNKTKLKDYENAINEYTGAIVVAHPSNFRVLGFTAEAELRDLSDLAHTHGLPLIHDLGGGVLLDLRRFGLPYEPLVQDSIAAGADVVTFSGDKVMGGVQSGLIVGKKEYIERIHSNPIMRVVRCDKLVFSALEATLKLYFSDKTLLSENKTLRMMAVPVDVVEQRAQKVFSGLVRDLTDNYHIKIVETHAQAGSGALPLEKLPSRALCLSPGRDKAENLTAKLRDMEPPVMGYVQDERIYLDMRTVSDEETETLAAILNALLNSGIKT